MSEKLIHLKPAPFIFCSVALFLLFLLGTLFFAESPPPLSVLLISTIFSILAALGFSFVICGTFQVIESFRSGYLTRSDALDTVLIAGIVGLWGLFGLLFPTVDLIIVGLLVLIWMTATIRRRIFGKPD